MGTTTNTVRCPNCDDEQWCKETIDTYDDIVFSTGRCLACGCYWFPQFNQMDLDQLNKERAEVEEDLGTPFPPLPALPPWTLS